MGLRSRSQPSSKKGQRVVEFVGEVMDGAQVAERYDQHRRDARYLVALGSDDTLCTRIR
jgi:hypothetical protein